MPAGLGVRIQDDSDIADLLPEGPAEKLRRLRDGTAAAYGPLRMTLDRMGALRTQSEEAQGRVLYLKAPPFGKAVADDHPDYVAAAKATKSVAAELLRQQTIHDQQAATWSLRANLASAAERAVRDAVQAFRPISESSVEPVLKKGEAIAVAIEGRRRRARELAADLNRVQSAPIKSADAKRLMRAQIAALAQRGQPYTAGLIEHGEPIEFADIQRSALARGEQPAAVGWTEPDMLATFAWLHQAALIARLDAEISEVADDEAALDDKTRAAQIATITSDLTAVEYEEAALCWTALDQGVPIEFRVDISPVALLGIEVGDAVEPVVPGMVGTSPQWAAVVAGHERRTEPDPDAIVAPSERWE